jgi:pimeloyl-ACP methyl ester carboxylesterase
MTDLVLLHGALASTQQFEALRPLLEEGFAVHTLDFEGHGVAAPVERSLRAEFLVENVMTYLDGNRLDKVSLFGYSLGGYIACMIARLHPERVGRVATLGTRFFWDDATLERELRMVEPATMKAKVPGFVQMLASHHSASGWEAVVTQTRNLLRAIHETGGFTALDLAEITRPVRVIVGDRDGTAGIAESVAAFQALQNGQLEVLPGTPHPLDRVDKARLAASLAAFFG